MLNTLLQLGYLLAACMFILGIRKLSKVRSARQGNQFAAAAMLLAVVITLVDLGNIDYRWILGGLAVGTAVGVFAAVRVQMTGMPELVAMFNGFGGAASALVALSIFFRTMGTQTGATVDVAAAMGGSHIAVAGVLSLVVGSITFTGSLIAFLKLNGSVRGNHFVFAGRNAVNGLLLLGTLAAGAAVVFVPLAPDVTIMVFSAALVVALIVGITGTSPIGGADMPVVISLLNSLSGVAASMAGFAVDNHLLIIAGSLVGASGLILTQIMCKAMNRTLGAVLFKSFGGSADSGRDGYENVKEASAEEVAMMMDDISTLVVVPGYGLAVAQAQHTTRELANLLEAKGISVRYAIHPVAGRMPGHMNVLLAEADVPYEQLVEMDNINGDFKTTDMVMVLGANDVVNPAALDEPDSPIYGMPILNVHEARQVVVVKRSLSPGFAGIANRLFDNDNTIMVFGDAKKVLQDLVSEVKNA